MWRKIQSALKVVTASHLFPVYLSLFSQTVILQTVCIFVLSIKPKDIKTTAGEFKAVLIELKVNCQLAGFTYLTQQGICFNQQNSCYVMQRFTFFSRSFFFFLFPKYALIICCTFFGKWNKLNEGQLVYDLTCFPLLLNAFVGAF